MAIMITDVCINCGACEPECPNNAIYEGGAAWRWGEGTALKQISKDGIVMDANTPQEPLSNEFYYIVTDKCTECVGFHEEPQCAAVCPVNCCVPDLQHQETKEELLKKKNWLHST
ncbi:MAG: ferredoxin [Candidatus Amoebophilus sp. 36-38]|nr:MAG: ferredoxin [Candidatus Amoebophilus sp. 36-38]